MAISLSEQNPTNLGIIKTIVKNASTTSDFANTVVIAIARNISVGPVIAETLAMVIAHIGVGTNVITVLSIIVALASTITVPGRAIPESWFGTMFPATRLRL